MHRPKSGPLPVFLVLTALLLISACNGGDVDSTAAEAGSGSATSGEAAGTGESAAGCDTGDVKQEDDPCILSTVEQLQDLSNKAGNHYALAGDVDASSTAGWNDGAGFVPIRHFRGTLDGRGHVISDLHISLDSDADGRWAGMFANTNKGSEIRNLGLKDATVTVEEGESVGSLIGNLQGSARNVWAHADVEAEETVGGLVGSIAGDGELENAWSSGTVTAGTKGGGLVGSNYGTVNNTYSTAAVEVRLGDSGGIAASNSGTIENSYWDTEETGIAEAGNAEGRTSGQMRQAATYAGWDFTDTWTIQEGESYPDLVAAPRGN